MYKDIAQQFKSGVSVYLSSATVHKGSLPGVCYCYLLCSLLVGLSPWSLRCVFGEARGSGMEDTSCVCSLYQCGSSSKSAVSNSIRICQEEEPTPLRGRTHCLTNQVPLLLQFHTDNNYCKNLPDPVGHRLGSEKTWPRILLQSGGEYYKWVSFRLQSWFPYLTQEFTLLFSHPGLVPQRNLQHALSELPPVHRRVHKGLVPLRL